MPVRESGQKLYDLKSRIFVTPNKIVTSWFEQDRILFALAAPLLRPRGKRLVVDPGQVSKLLPTQTALFKLIENLFAMLLRHLDPPQYISLENLSLVLRIRHTTYAMTFMIRLNRGTRRVAYEKMHFDFLAFSNQRR